MKISWSKYQSYQVCGLQYHLKYRVRPKVFHLRKPFVAGSIVHDTIGWWAKEGYPREGIEAKLKEVWAHQTKGMTFKSREAVAALFKKVATGTVTTAKIYRALKFHIHDTVVEPRFNIPLRSAPEHSINGGYDLYDRTASLLIDLKMYTDAGHVGKPTQLLHYGVALRNDGDEVKKVGFVLPLLKDKFQTVAVTPADLDAHEATIIDLVENESNRAPVPEPGSHCQWCDYYRTVHCPVKGPADIPVESKGSVNIIDMRNMGRK